MSVGHCASPRSSARFVLALLAILLSLCVSPIRSQELGGGVASKENLDLPFDAMGEEEEEEDAPEIVTFYGQQLEADGFFYIIDSSGSMRDSGELEVAKREIIRNISEFSDQVEFGIVFFNANISKYPPSGQPAQANPGMKSAASAWVQAYQGASGSCVQQGFTQLIQLANFASAKRKVMVYLGDGGGTCGGEEATYLRAALSSITAMNYQRIQINTIGFREPAQINTDFLKRLATANGGTYTKKL